MEGTLPLFRWVSFPKPCGVERTRKDELVDAFPRDNFLDRVQHAQRVVIWGLDRNICWIG